MVRQKQGGILLDAKFRPAGEGEKDGKAFTWDEAYIITSRICRLYPYTADVPL